MMAKVYMLTEADMEALVAAVNEDPQRGGQNPTTPELRRAHDDAFRFFNYRVRTWIEKVTR